MKKTAFLGPLVCLLTVIFAWAGGGSSISSSGDKDPLYDMPESCRNDRVVLPGATQFFSAHMMLELAQVGSYGFYSFAVIVTVPTLRNQMKVPKKTAPAAIVAYCMAILMFLPIMFLGYAGFGDQVPENLIDGMRHNRPAGWWALNRPWEIGDITPAGTTLDFVVTLNLLLTEAIYIPCTVLAIEASFPSVFRQGPPWAGKAMRVAFIFVRLLVATCVESFVAMSALVSSMFCVCNNILIPVAAFHWTKAKEVSRPRKFMHGIMFGYGIFIMLLGTYSAIAALGPHDVVKPGSTLREGISAECEAAYRLLNLSDAVDSGHGA